VTATWTGEELDRIGEAEELEIAARRVDGTLRKPVAIWIVRVDDDLYVRSWRGSDGHWLRAAQARREGRISAGGIDTNVVFLDIDEAVDDAVDAAYREKYRHYPNYVAPMTSDQARATTLKLLPARTETGSA
jgi:hypothetical protein